LVRGGDANFLRRFEEVSAKSHDMLTGFEVPSNAGCFLA
jgi:hypothetical protein